MEGVPGIRIARAPCGPASGGGTCRGACERVGCGVKLRVRVCCTCLALTRSMVCGVWDHLQIKQAEEALSVHTGTGRLWAVLMQLRQADGDMAQLQVFQRALQQVPKSGEVWCEGARIAMNIYSIYFDLTSANAYLNFAIQFTPQYGDSFIGAWACVVLWLRAAWATSNDPLRQSCCG